MLQNSRLAAFTISELIWENQQKGGIKLTPSLLQKRKLNIKIEQQFNTKY